MKTLKLMSAVALLVLSACTDASVLNDIKKQNDQDAEGQAQEDPSLYVLTATVSMGYDQATSGTFSANWEDEGGTVELGNENRSTVLKRSSATALNGEGYSFTFTYNGTNYPSGKLSLSECETLAKSLGYDAGPFRRMDVAYSLGYEVISENPVPIKEGEPLPPPPPPPQLILSRAPAVSSGQDAKAVVCRTAAPNGKRLLRLSVQGKISEAWRLMSEDKSLINPGELELESAPFERATQTFYFTFDRSSDVETNQIPLKIQTPQGEKAFTASFKSCISIDKSGYGDPSRINKLISEDISIFLDDKGEVKEGASRTCCYSSGSCTRFSP